VKRNEYGKFPSLFLSYTAIHIKDILELTFRNFFMSEFISELQPKKVVRMADLSFDEKERLVGAFAWLLEEDRKQNPELYKPNKT